MKTNTANNSAVLRNPRITEKASMVLNANVYIFDVAPSATKSEVKKAVKALYKVTPMKVNIATVRPKNIVVRGKKGVRSGGKKAMVYLKKEDKIEIV